MSIPQKNEVGKSYSIFDYIEKYISAGLPVFPCSLKKSPKTEHGLKDATTDINIVRKWKPLWGEFIGITIPPGFIAIDVDVKNGARGKESFEKLIKELGQLPETLNATTGSGGLHYLFSYDPNVSFSNVNGIIAPGIDIKASGKGYLIVAPGLPTTGKTYRWNMDENTFMACHDIKSLILPLPEKWAKYILSKAKEKKPAKDEGTTTAGKYPTGTRNSSLTSELGYRRSVLGEDRATLLKIGLLLNEIKCDPPLPAAEIESIVESICKYEDIKIENFSFDDIGNAERLVKYYGGKLRYCSTTKKWFAFDGSKWNENNAAAHALAKELVKRMKARLKEIEHTPGIEEKFVKSFRAHVKSSASSGKLNSILEVAHSEPTLNVRQEDFDNPDFCCYKLNVGNGTLHLDNLIDYEWSDIQAKPDLILKQHSGDDMVTKRIDINFDPSKDCPKFKDFLNKIFKYNVALIEYMQAFLGSALTDEVADQSFQIWYGNGANGKSTLGNFIEIILKSGVYCGHIPIRFLKKSDRDEKKENHMAKIQGTRFVTSLEPSETFRLDDSFIKLLTGGDTVTARKLFGEPFDYKPTYKLAIATNNKPIITATDHGIWRRVKLINFEHKIEKKIPNFEKTIPEEYPGILNWLILGFIKIQKLKIDGKKLEDIEPECVKAATAEYQQESDIVQSFIVEKCETGKDKKIPTTFLYRAFETWFKETQGEHCISLKKFVGKLRNKGFEKSDKTLNDFYCNSKYRGYYIYGIDLSHEGTMDITTITGN